MYKEKTIRLFIYEEQELYRELYSALLQTRSSITITGITSEPYASALFSEVSSIKPDVLLLGIKKVSSHLISELEKIRYSWPAMGIIILVNQYNKDDMKNLRKVVLSGANGTALLLRLSLDSLDHLVQTIISVDEGQVILDPSMAAGLFSANRENRLLKQLTAREMEILGLLSQGYTNNAIADELFIDIKTVEHHLNSLYGKLKTDPDYHAKHLRVSAARLYLETLGITEKACNELAAPLLR